ncbi:MAG: putative periplasmic ligand-binding sensor protein [Tardiphaga sp.]|nr:putative periplasmic ligand-binding sensor protein [Tardiphaga sp.]
MTPQERQLIDDLFGRLAKVEGAPRDREASEAIAQGLRQAPNAVYALVQTVLVQDEALKRADARIQELEAGDPAARQPPGGFLDSMRDALFGGNQNSPAGSSRGSVPPAGGRPVWNTGQVTGQTPGGQNGQPQGAPRQFNQGGQFGQPPQQSGGGGGSFLGTAAATVAGVVGGGLLMNSIRGMMGGGEGHNRSGFGDSANASESKTPWSGDSSSNNDLAKDAGVNDIGSRHSDNASGGDQQYGAYDNASNDADDADIGDDFDGGGDSDYA